MENLMLKTNQYIKKIVHKTIEACNIRTKSIIEK